MNVSESYCEAFIWHKKNRMESPKIEQAEFAEDLILEWLAIADKEIAELKADLERERGGI